MRVLAILALLAGLARADDRPSNGKLVGAGLAMAIPTYLVGVTLHEGSHALAAVMVGAEVDHLHVFPPGIDPKAKVFRFGWTYVHGLKTRNERAFFYLAPKITDAILLGGFASLAFTDVWPSNHYGALALTVFATGLWVDFAKDVVMFRPSNDIVRAFDQWCIKGWRQIPARLIYAGAAVGLGFVVAKGYERVFERDSSAASPRIAPLFSTAF